MLQVVLTVNLSWKVQVPLKIVHELSHAERVDTGGTGNMRTSVPFIQGSSLDMNHLLAGSLFQIFVSCRPMDKTMNYCFHYNNAQEFQIKFCFIVFLV